MKRHLTLCLGLALLVSLTIAAVAQQKLAQTGFNFLSVGTDARATGMGEASATMGGTSSALLYNPAGIASLHDFVDLGTSQLNWIADIRFLSGTLALAPFDGEYGVIGVSLLGVNYGEFKFTRVAATEQGYEDIVGLPKPWAYMVGVGYGKEVSTRFSVGGQVKHVFQSLGESTIPVYTNVVDGSGNVRRDTSLVRQEYSASVLAFDFGTIYRTGWRSLAFGMSITNFSREVKYVSEQFQLPLAFRFGVSMDLMDLFPALEEDHALTVSVDAVHPRSYPELMNIGGEYVFGGIIALRVGYITQHDDYGFTAGLGARRMGVSVDYSFTPHDIFNDLQRFSVRFTY